MRNLLKLKDGRILNITDSFLWSEITNIFNHPDSPADYEFKSPATGKVIKKSDIEEIIKPELPKEEVFFKLKYGFGEHECKTINIKEYEKALFAQMQGDKGLYVGDGLSLRGDRIILLDLDGNKMCGFNPDYKPEGEHLRAVIEKKEEFRYLIEDTKSKIRWCLQNKQAKEIGTGIPLSEITKRLN